MKHILFFDIDGTLRDEVYGVPETARTAVSLCRDRGHLICLCTGRTLSTIPDDVQNLDVDGVIAGGGSYIRFGDQVIQDCWFPAVNIRSAFHYLKDLEDNIAFALEGKVVAPVSGLLVTAYPTGHAYGIRTDDGLEVLIHIGMDTVELNGLGFIPHAMQRNHQVVRAGQALALTWNAS